MKIDGTKSSSDVQKKKEAGKSLGQGGSFGSMIGGGDSVSSVNSGGLSSGIASIDVLLAAQSAEDPAQQKSKRRMQERAKDILGKLNEIKIAILTNRVTVGHMISIADVVATHRENISDPELSAILDEIDLRAHVELAKLQMAKASLSRY